MGVVLSLILRKDGRVPPNCSAIQGGVISFSFAITSFNHSAIAKELNSLRLVLLYGHSSHCQRTTTVHLLAD